MANYTELLGDYLSGGGELPAALDTIDGFKTLFVARYCDCEIGFETETLFATKLEYRANLVMPYYVRRLADLERVATAMSNPQKVRTTKVVAGEQASQQFTLPLNSNTASPSAKNHIDSFENNDTSTESGYTVDEALRVQDYYNSGVQMLLEKCLDEFKSCFMGIY